MWPSTVWQPAGPPDRPLPLEFIKKLITVVGPSYFYGTAVVRVVRCTSVEKNKKKNVPATKVIQLISFQTMKTQELLDVIRIFWHGQNKMFSSGARFVNSPPEAEAALPKLMFKATKTN